MTFDQIIAANTSYVDTWLARAWAAYGDDNTIYNNQAELLSSYNENGTMPDITDPDNNAPVFGEDTYTDEMEADGTGLELVLDATDADADDLAFCLNDETVFTIDDNGTITLVGDAPDAGEYTLTATVTDGNGGEDTANVIITVNAAPAVTTESVDNLGTQQNHDTTSFADADTAAFQFTDNAVMPNYVEITGFGADDSIVYSNAVEGDVVIDYGADTTLTINNDGVVSQIVLVGVESGLGDTLADLGNITFA